MREERRKVQEDVDGGSSSDEVRGVAESSDPCEAYAAPLTLEACRCPHLDALLPHFLVDGEKSLHTALEGDDHCCPLLPPYLTNRRASNKHGATLEQNSSTGRFQELRDRERHLLKTRRTSSPHLSLSKRKLSSDNDIDLEEKSRGETTDISSQREMEVQRMAAARVEEYLEVVRQNRLAFHDSRKRSKIHAAPPWGSMPTHNTKGRSTMARCAWCCSTEKSFPTDGDDLMQCLDCSIVGCGPDFVVAGRSRTTTRKQHLMRHFLATSHTFGITCGSRAELYCKKCGDFVYSSVVDAEKERVDIQRCVPWLGWKEHAIRRSFSTNSFVLVEGDHLIWRGLLATYPRVVPRSLVRAARSSLRRWNMLRGHFEETWGPRATKLASRQCLHHDGSTTTDVGMVTRPVGIYNLGNTCFVSCIFQCLVHCHALQTYFLRDGRHHYQSCALLRQSEMKRRRHRDEMDDNNETNNNGCHDVCLACEMDLFFLEYFGSSIGMNVVSALEEASDPAARSIDLGAKEGAANVTNMSESESTTIGVVTNNTQPNNRQQERSWNTIVGECGIPLIPSRLLSRIWRCDDMEQMAGYEQRDAHEFLQTFLIALGKRSKMFHDMAKDRSNNVSKSIHDRYDENNPTAIPTPTTNEGNIVKKLFEGTLRSVLICNTCGYKRSQLEPFLSISLALLEEKEEDDSPSLNTTMSESSSSHTTTVTRSHHTQRATTATKNITLTGCLKHFTRPEQLLEHVHCSSCDCHTVTKKQHTFCRLPQILCIHLKRFETANKKMENPVSSPPVLDMGPYLPHWREVFQGEDDTLFATDNNNDDNTPSSQQQDDETAKDVSCPKVYYKLFGCITHIGTLHQGHYVSNVKVNDGQWFHCNDAFVSNLEIDNDEVIQKKMQDAYILFYHRM